MRSFSSFVIDAPGLCSPSRMVVSNMINFSFFMSVSALILPVRADSRRRTQFKIDPGSVRSGRKQQ